MFTVDFPMAFVIGFLQGTALILAVRALRSAKQAEQALRAALSGALAARAAANGIGVDRLDPPMRLTRSERVYLELLQDGPIEANGSSVCPELRLPIEHGLATVRFINPDAGDARPGHWICELTDQGRQVLAQSEGRERRMLVTVAH